MAYSSIYKGIIFIEGEEPTARLLQSVEYKKRHTFNAQLKTLDNVKDQLVEQALAQGANAIIRFTYGQKSVGWFRGLFFSIDDDVNWYANGVAAILQQSKVEEIINKIKSL